MARTALTGAINVVRIVLMNANAPTRFTNRLRRAKKGGRDHRATLLLAAFGNEDLLRERAAALLVSQF